MTDQKPFTSTRRGFVVTGSTAMLLAATRGMAGQFMQVIYGTDQGAMPILSVGYWDGMNRGAESETPTSHIVSAQAAGGDNRFTRGAALVTTYGFWRAPKNRQSPLSLSLIAFYPQIDPATGRKTPFVAWNASITSRGVNGTLRSHFVIPVDKDNQIEIAVDSRSENGRRSVVERTAAPSDLDRVRALITDRSSVLALGTSLALRRGVYFVALREKDVEEIPDWSRIRVTGLRSTDRVQPDGDGILVGSDGNPVSFDYIVLLVEPYGVSDGRDPAKADRSN
jgi:hypothetical protein